jgi:hypothetical protein
MRHWKEFVLAGNALFTLEDSLTGERFTYHVRKHDTKPMWWVKVLSGPDNVCNYEYIGTLFEDDFQVTGRSRVTESATCFRWFKRLITVLKSDNDLDPRMRVRHSNRCGRCGRLLTVPASVEWGFGPECVLHVFGEANHSHVALEDAKKIRELMKLQSKLEKVEAAGE